jgi:peptide/nickel transport system substrate-binding protein
MKEVFNAKVPQYDYDVAKANQMLDEAGVKRGSDGVRFKTTIYGTPGVRAILSEILKEQLRAVGISADIVINEWTTFYAAVRQTRTADGIFTIFSLPNVPDPMTESPRYYSKEIRPGGATISSATPRGRHHRRCPADGRSRQAWLLYEYQDILARDVPMIPLYVLAGVDA